MKKYILLVLSFVLLSPASWANPKSCEDYLVKKSSEKGPELDLAAWKKLPSGRRFLILNRLDQFTTSDLFPPGTELHVIESADALEKLEAAKMRGLAKLMLRRFDDQVGDLDPDSFGLIHTPKVSFYVLMNSSSHVILGVQIHQCYQGYKTEDQPGLEHSYATLEQAKKAGADTEDDIMWSAHVIFDYDAKPIGGSDYWEWTGW